MDHDEYTLEYFCRLCASEGVVIHPLFPPGDEDPKDELVRMIDVLTSITLTRTQDSGAVICDKCLQMMDVFCQFREECLKQDVMIRTRRELEKERREEEERRLAVERQQQLAAAIAAAAAAAVAQQQMVPVEPDVLIKEEEDAEIIPTIVIDDCKEEPDEEEDDDEDDEPQSADSSLVANSSSSGSFQSPAEISLYSQTSNLSISVQVNQISLGGGISPGLVTIPTGTSPSATTSASSTLSESRPSRVAFRKGKLDPNKPPPDCDLCQESFSTHYDFEQHMDSVHAWDRGTRCSLACDPCQMRFTKSYNLKRHMYEVHGELAPGLTVTACDFCGLKFLRGYTLNRHIAKVHSKHRKTKKMMIIKSK